MLQVPVIVGRFEAFWPRMKIGLSAVPVQEKSLPPSVPCTSTTAPAGRLDGIEQRGALGVPIERESLQPLFEST